jgi:hypothetical protein
LTSAGTTGFGAHFRFNPVCEANHLPFGKWGATVDPGERNRFDEENEMKALTLNLPFVLAVVVLAFVTAAAPRPAAATRSTVLDQAEFAFACPETNDIYQCTQSDALPDPATWTADRMPAGDPGAWCVGGGQLVAQCAWPDTGLTLADPGNSARLLYGYQPAQLSGDPASPAFSNTARFRVVSSAEYVPDGSAYWSAESTAWRMVFDDGRHRLELKFARSTTGRRQVWIGNTAMAPFEFPWDNGLANTYEIARHSNGDFTVTIQNADPAVPVQSQLVPGGMLEWTHGAPLVAWGMAGEGGGVAHWTAVQFDVSPASGTVSGRGSISSPAGAIADNPGAKGPAAFSLSGKFAKGMPSGQVAFDFAAGNLSFKSTDLESLRITETGAQIQGSGTVNGADGYRFILRVADGGANGGSDAYHLRIWDPATYTGHNATYDNEPSLDPWWHEATWPLSGGSIKLR